MKQFFIKVAAPSVVVIFVVALLYKSLDKTDIYPDSEFVYYVEIIAKHIPFSIAISAICLLLAWFVKENDLKIGFYIIAIGSFLVSLYMLMHDLGTSILG